MHGSSPTSGKGSFLLVCLCNAFVLGVLEFPTLDRLVGWRATGSVRFFFSGAVTVTVAGTVAITGKSTALATIAALAMIKAAIKVVAKGTAP